MGSPPHRGDEGHQSATYKNRLTERVHIQQSRQWRRENVTALRACNRVVEEFGIFGDHEQRF